MHVIIPVAGKGTRLRPHTHTTAKPLVHVAGKPVLQHILDRIAPLGVTEVILITGHLGDQFKDLQAPFPVRMIEQHEQLGTAHAIGLAKPYVTGDVFIVFADTVFDADLSIVKTTDADGLVWVKEVEDYQRFGVVVHTNGVMNRIVEKPSEPISKLANIGMYWFRDSAAFFAANDKVLAGPPTKGEFYMTESIQNLVDQGKCLHVEPVTGWYDCGTHKDLIETNRVLLTQSAKTRDIPGSVLIQPVWIEDNVTITNSIVGPYVSVGAGAVIENSIVSDSIVNIKAKLERANLNASIIGEGAEVKGAQQKVSLGSHSTLEL